MIDFFVQLPLVELFIRMVATALIVMSVATAVGKLGPIAGGLVAGLPIGLGPGFYFLLDTGSTDFLLQATIFSLLSLSATQVFLTTYLTTARHDYPKTSLALAVCVWWGVIWMLNTFPVTIVSAALLFIALTVSARLTSRRFLMLNVITERREGFFILLLRAVFGGILVAMVTVFAPLLGAKLSGIILAFPIGYALIALTIHQQFGASTAIGVVYSAQLGTISLATFCVAFAIGLQSLSPMAALLAGLAASVSITAAMMRVVRITKPSH